MVTRLLITAFLFISVYKSGVSQHRIQFRTEHGLSNFIIIDKESSTDFANQFSSDYCFAHSILLSWRLNEIFFIDGGLSFFKNSSINLTPIYHQKIPEYAYYIGIPLLLGIRIKSKHIIEGGAGTGKFLKNYPDYSPLGYNDLVVFGELGYAYCLNDLMSIGISGKWDVTKTICPFGFTSGVDIFLKNRSYQFTLQFNLSEILRKVE